MVYGDEVTAAPNGEPSSRNCTDAMLLSVELAIAVTVIVELTMAPEIGVEIKIVGGMFPTLTVVVAVLAPFGLVAVSVYVVVDVGCTTRDPTRVEVEKEPDVMATELAFVTFQESVEVAEGAVLEGEAEKLKIVGGVDVARERVNASLSTASTRANSLSDGTYWNLPKVP